MNAQKTPSNVLFSTVDQSTHHMVQRSQQMYVYGGKEAWVYRASAAPSDSPEWAGWNVMRDGEVVATGFETHAEAFNWARDALTA